MSSQDPVVFFLAPGAKVTVTSSGKRTHTVAVLVNRGINFTVVLESFGATVSVTSPME